MDTFLYFVVRGILRAVQALPLRWVARLGRGIGALVWFFDRRHRNVALRNLNMCLGRDYSPEEIRSLAAENLRRIGENFACAVKTAVMSLEELRPHVDFGGVAREMDLGRSSGQRKLVVAIGHFGNFELYARFTAIAPDFELATTYRALRQPGLSRLLLGLRERSGCHYFERRADAHSLKAFMNGPRVMLGLLSDQHAGNNGLRLPFFGHDCSTSAAPALFALRYHAELYTGICFRTGLAQWRIEAGSQIPTHEGGKPRTVEAIMLDVNRALEAAVRRDPANWFWVHNRWKPAKPGKTKPPVVSEPEAGVSAR